MTRIRWAVAVVSVFVVGFGVVLAVALGSKDDAGGGPRVGVPAPAFTLTDFDNNSLSLSDYRGKVVLVNFWNEWCDPCIEETPSLVGLAKARLEDPGFAMIGVVHDPRTQDATRRYAKLNEMNYALGFDPGARIALNYSVTGQPETVVIDPNGIVVKWISGPIDVRAVDALVTQLEQTQGSGSSAGSR